MTGLTMGVVGTARKENELRAPIDPVHIAHIAPELRRRIWFETGYGERFGVQDSEIDSLAAGHLDRNALFDRCDIVVLAKPAEEDFPSLREGRILWGWPHCVQGEAITQVAIDRGLTLIAWEAMNLWLAGEVRGLHVFHKNNEIAGYAAVLHATQLCGTTGLYGPAQRAAVIHSGLTARGALHALKGLGYSDLTCFTVLQDHELGAQIPGVRYLRLVQAEEGPETYALEESGALVPMADELAEYDLIVNCIFQDTDASLGFDFARPTTFEEPMFDAGAGVLYYAVDHTPSLLWRSATFEISRALLPYLATVLGGPEAWEADATIHRAIEIREGRILNPKILNFQNRAEDYPYAKLA
ncbi:MAG: Rossmann-fold NAD(P)-binding domain-containing protein [Planctomycetota bacterium]|jgi:alanine dehydrogenase